MPQETLNVICLKHDYDGECWLFLYDGIVDVIKAIRDEVLDPDSNLTYVDADVLMTAAEHLEEIDDSLGKSYEAL